VHRTHVEDAEDAEDAEYAEYAEYADGWERIYSEGSPGYRRDLPRLADIQWPSLNIVLGGGLEWRANPHQAALKLATSTPLSLDWQSDRG